jgi:flagellin-like protein
MRKGVTPVVATVLLMTVTVAATGTVYTLIQENTENAQQQIEGSELGLNIDTLQVERCYNNYGRTHIVMRNNNAEESINASRITPLLNGSIQRNYKVETEIVAPKRSFTVNLSKEFGPETQVILTDGNTQITHNCIDL